MAVLNSFEDLKCWQPCRRFKLFIHDLVKGFPKEKLHLMTSQLKRSSRSTTHNIAEGFGRDNVLDNARFCKMARGSLMEALDQLITCADEGLISGTDLKKGRELFAESRAWLEGYTKYLERSKEASMLREPEMTYYVDGLVDEEVTNLQLPTSNLQPLQQ